MVYNANPAEQPKLIGVCLSQAHTFLKEDFLCELEREARKEGMGLLVFNSSMDWYWSRHGGNITGCIYDMIRFDRLSALVIMHGDIYNEEQLSRMIHGAKKQKIPVLYLGGKDPRCVSVVDDYAEPYRELIRHLVRDHGVRDTFYIAGLEGEGNSMLRLQCWKDVMNEFGLPCGEDRFAFGNYLDTIALQILQDLIAKSAVPRAILCANDSMAVAVCEHLRKNGFRLPEDVIVTGFDGTPTAFLIRPQLTTCTNNSRDLARMVMEEIHGFDPEAEEPAEPRVLTHRYSIVKTCSCGCPPVIHERFTVLHTLRQAEMLYTHENKTYYAVDRMLEEKELYPFLGKIGETLLPGSALYLNRGLLESDPDTDHMPDRPEEELIMVSASEADKALNLRKVYLRDLPLPSPASPGITVLNIVHSGSKVCGYYAAHTEDLVSDSQLIKRLSDVLNMIASVQLGRIRQHQLVARLENNLYVDDVSGFSNLKGLTRWYEQYIAREGVQNRVLALSVYSMPKYSWIYETYGMAETEEVIRTVSRMLREANPEAMHIARVSEDSFAVVDAPEDERVLSALIQSTVAAFYKQVEQYNTGTTRSYYLDVSCGLTHLAPVWTPVHLENLISLAMGEMYLSRLRDTAPEDPNQSSTDVARIGAFNLLMEKNLFRFHFQPIVDAHSGMIYGYEALMRTDPIIDMTPLEILKIAREQGRLDEVERATVFGIMERFVRSFDDFQGNKVFINTIPGHFLSEEDCTALIGKYESFLDCFVFELTEDSPASDVELERLKRLCKPGAQTQIAVDDFGTGHSNIVNLLRYAPQIIKIDRGLISGITTDYNRRLFVRNTIDFAHKNGIRALAEGVETLDELRSVIACGIDLIQGFYTGRPSEFPVRNIADKVVRQILDENTILMRGEKEMKLYEGQDGEIIDLLDLALRKVSCVILPNGTYTVRGEKSHSVDICIRVQDNARVSLTLEHVNIAGPSEPCIHLGANSVLDLRLEGQNTLNREGIAVPPTARLNMRGSGNLMVHNTRNYAVGIGANFNDPYGTIDIEMDGVLIVRTSGNKSVSIGGGSSGGEGIRVRGGTLDLVSNGVSVVVIGSSVGDAKIDMEDVRLTAHAEGNDVLLIGSISGSADIEMSGDYILSSACERTTVLGTSNGTAEVLLKGGSLKADVHCDSGAVIGTFGGEARVTCRDMAVRIHGEGNRLAGFGSLNGACDTRVQSGFLSGELLAGERFLLGNNHSRFVVTGGNFSLFPENNSTPVSPCGNPLHYETPPGDHYEKTFTDRRATWTYRADRDENGHLGVWIP